MESATIYTGCQNCDAEDEFTGKVLEDIAYFPCPHCREVFTLGSLGGWADFLTKLDEEEGGE